MTNALYSELFGVHSGQKSPFIFSPDGTIVTYEDFIKLGSRYAHVLNRLGLVPGDRLLVQIEKSPQALALYAACIQTGIIFLPLNPAYAAEELTYFVKDSEPSLVVCDANSPLVHDSHADLLDARVETLNQNGSGSLTAETKGMPSRYQTVARSSDDLVALLYTSGTTGRPKGAMLTQENLLSNAHVLKKLWAFESSDVLLHALPIFHSHGLFVATNVTLLSGGLLIFLPKFDREEIIKYIPMATAMMGVPTFYTRLLNSPDLTKELTRNMRLFVSGSAPLLAETHKQFEQRTGHSILERYGLTETSMNTSNPYSGERRPGTVGFPLPGVEVKITDTRTGQKVSPGEIGQIEIRGPNVCKGYWRRPNQTAKEFQPDGFFITGDLGKVDSDGFLHIEGRNKDLIISGGYNVYPKEIELFLDRQPGVLESVVIGVPHSDFGEAVVGLLVPNKNANPDLSAITSAASVFLARYKHPKKLLVVKALPRNTMGKVQKNVLRAEYNKLFN